MVYCKSYVGRGRVVVGLNTLVQNNLSSQKSTAVSENIFFFTWVSVCRPSNSVNIKLLGDTVRFRGCHPALLRVGAGVVESVRQFPEAFRSLAAEAAIVLSSCS